MKYIFFLKRYRDKLIRKTLNGFTVIELLVVIAIMGILTTIGIVSFTSIQASARNTQRSSKVTILSEALEKYYDSNGEYPSCAALTASPGTVTTTTLKGVEQDVLTSPTAVSGTNSISCTTPTVNTYGYIGGGNSFTLMYQGEGDASPTSVSSRRHVVSAIYTLTLVAGTGGSISGGGSYASGSTPTIVATPNANYSFSSWTGTNCSGASSHAVTITGDITCTANFTPTTIAVPSVPTVTANTVSATTTWSWGAVSCPGNTARYQYRYTISPSGYDSGIVATASTSVAFTTSTEGQTYTVATQAECYNAVTSSGMSGSESGSYYRPVSTVWGCMDPSANNYNSSANADDGSCTYTAPAAPAAPVVIADAPVGSATLWHWNAASCVNSTATYQFIWSNNVNPESTWLDYSLTQNNLYSGDQGVTYTMQVRAKCYTSHVSSSWSGAGSATYYRPVGMPGQPYVTTPTTGASTTWSWPASSCSYSTGIAPRYQYRYTISPSGYNSGLVITSATSLTFTTSTAGQTYTVAVQSECYNSNTGASSGLTTAGSASYFRPGAGPVNGWYSGITATALAGKKIYETDLGSTYMYETSYTAVASPQGATGLDPNYPSQMVLVSPQTNPGVDFSAYPAQNACKAIGGRLPNTQELLVMYADRGLYGNNFQGEYHWSATEYAWVNNSSNAWTVDFPNNGSLGGVGKTYSSAYVRCVKD